MYTNLPNVQIVMPRHRHHFVYVFLCRSRHLWDLSWLENDEWQQDREGGKRYITRHHKHELVEDQCSSVLVKNIKALLHIIQSTRQIQAIYKTCANSTKYMKNVASVHPISELGALLESMTVEKFAESLEALLRC